MRSLFLADENLTTQKVFQSALAEGGIGVRCFSSADELLKAVETDPVDLVAVNVSMGGMDGYELCRLVKQEVRDRHLPVILLFGAFHWFDEAKAREAGCDRHLAKPFETAELKEVVRQLLGESLHGATQLKSPSGDPGHSGVRLFDLTIEAVQQDVVFELSLDQCSAEPAQLGRDCPAVPPAESAPEAAVLEETPPGQSAVADYDRPASPVEPDQVDLIVDRLLERLPEAIRRLMPELRSTSDPPD